MNVESMLLFIFQSLLTLLFRSFCGTPDYTPPEMFELGHTYSFEVDIWAIGIMLYSMLVGRTPFISENLEIICTNILDGGIEFPEDLIISNEAKDLILGILKSEPSKFPFDQIFSF
jgi:polo-like kinase 1